MQREGAEALEEEGLGRTSDLSLWLLKTTWRLSPSRLLPHDDKGAVTEAAGQSSSTPGPGSPQPGRLDLPGACEE